MIWVLIDEIQWVLFRKIPHLFRELFCKDVILNGRFAYCRLLKRTGRPAGTNQYRRCTTWNCPKAKKG